MSLKIENLHANIGDRQILKGLNLEVPKGEVHAIMGKNGSGKSTLSQKLCERTNAKLLNYSDFVRSSGLNANDDDALVIALI